MPIKRPTTPQKPKTSGRGGARPGAGRKANHVEADLRALMDEAWPYDERVAVIVALCKSAKNGNVKAAVALLDRALGKPIEYQVVDREASDKLKITVEYTDPEPRE
jgi:hypothetical protein